MTSQNDLLGLFAAMTQEEVPDLTTYVSTFEGNRYEELIAFLASSSSVNVDTFNEVGLKSLEELWQECVGRDVVLAIDSLGNVYRHAKSSKIQLLVPSAGIRYQEDWRRYIRPTQAFPRGRYLFHDTPKWEGISETNKRNESPLDAAYCGIEEELGPGTPVDSLVCVTPGRPFIERRPSKVYPGIRSVTVINRFKAELPEPLWAGRRKIIKDGNVEVHLGKFPMN
jgi:hypothetical protein